jgi:hypothetical protein
MKTIPRKYLFTLSLLAAVFIEMAALPINTKAVPMSMIAGTIKDEVTLEPIDGAIITTTGIGATISVSGVYTLNEIPGTWTLKARAFGYAPYTQEITVEETDLFIALDIFMVPLTTPPVPCVSEFLYGEHSSETVLLRYVRDSVLCKTLEGQELIKLYYQWSPVILNAMEEDEEFKNEVKELIDELLLMIEESTE